MSKRNSFYLICAVIAGQFGEVPAAEIILQPVSASGEHTIVGTEIRLASGGQRVRLEVQIKDFGPALLRTFQATLDSRGFVNTGSIPLRATFVGCPSEDSAGHQFCRNVLGETGVGAPRCDVPDGDLGAGLRCDAAWISQSRTDWLMFGRNSLPAVDMSNPNFRWGGATFPGEEVSDEGLSYYAGTLVLDVPVGAGGSFTIGWFDPSPQWTFLLNEHHLYIVPLILTSARLIIHCDKDAQCDDQSKCTMGHCDLATNECEFTQLNDGLNCDDGNACTMGDQCSLGKCVPQTSITCDDSDACHYSSMCIPETGLCSPPVPQPDNTWCTDNNPCTQGDRCIQGVCVSGTSRDCSGACLDGTCNPLTGQCSLLPNGTACNDGNPCSAGDRCVSGQCSPTSPLVCSNGDACNNSGTCNPSSGECGAPTPKPNGTSCTDNNLCTLNDFCSQGVCQSGPIRDCSGNPCFDGTCSTSTGQCRARAPGTECNDGNPCTVGDRCVGTICHPVSAVQCMGDACNYSGTCNPQTGICSMVPKPDGTVCHDGDLCTVSYCFDGVCDIEELHNCIRWRDFFSCIDGPQSPTETACDTFDLNSDGVVDLLDVAILIPRY